ncbi:helix-turn-helix domain-containing protein [Metaclostridioides mangenotii]|uniref:helix-turn-helix domain-containing protein n=1 Tax=Metaclostridioides mangenotii TaxID=1540 RepID=UPI00068AC348|nr:helix-turn-helix transcriptional regulator [Clostridioides mangenotii]
MELKNRIKELIKNTGLKQVEFANKIKVDPSYISKLLSENSKTIPSDRLLNDICREFNVSEEWLRTGKGEMYTLTENDALLAEALAQIAVSDDEKIRQIVTNLCYLDEKYVDMISDLIANLTEDQKKSKKEK